MNTNNTKDICWFCGTNQSSKSCAFTEELHKRTEEKITNILVASRHKIKYKKLKVLIPRCEECENKHKKISMVSFIIYLIFSLFIAGALTNGDSSFILIFLLNFIILSFIFLGIRWFLKKYIYKIKNIEYYPKIESLLNAGWEIGDKPYVNDMDAVTQFKDIKYDNKKEISVQTVANSLYLLIKNGHLDMPLIKQGGDELLSKKEKSFVLLAILETKLGEFGFKKQVIGLIISLFLLGSKKKINRDNMPIEILVVIDKLNKINNFFQPNTNVNEMEWRVNQLKGNVSFITKNKINEVDRILLLTFYIEISKIIDITLQESIDNFNIIYE